MRVVPATNLACPLDGLPLEQDGQNVRCEGGHTFDVAREGYCNLLVVQHKASRDPGDSSQMVAARRRFLDGGYFEPIAADLFKVVRRCIVPRPEGTKTTILDAGCGEGYYLNRLARDAAASIDRDTLSLEGIDVSKWAVKAAAKRPRQEPITWLVANNRRPPFLGGSVDIILCLFGFPVWEGFRSVQAPGGCVILVDPGPDHLIELRQIIYPTVNRSAPPTLASAQAAGYVHDWTHDVRCTIQLNDSAVIADLLAMTPHGHRLSDVGRDALAAVAALAALTVTVDVTMRVLKLKG